MKKIIGLCLVTLLIAGTSLAYNSKCSVEASTVGTSAVKSVIFPKSVNSISIWNDNTATAEVLYVNLDGSLTTINRITREAFPLYAGEWIENSNFQTNKIKLYAKSGTISYRVKADYN